MNRLIRAGLAVWLAVQVVSAFAVTGFAYDSSEGDPVGGGRTGTLESPWATIVASGTGSRVSISATGAGEWWLIDLESPEGSVLRPGRYPNAARPVSKSPMQPGLDVSNSGGCNEIKGWFSVFEYEVDDNGQVLRLAIDFVQNCEVTGPPLYGAVRINSEYPLQAPDTVAVAGLDSYALEGEKVALDGMQSFSRQAAPLRHRWTQVDGPAVVLDKPKSARPRFIAPAVGLEGASLRFRLDVTDAAGHASTDDVVVLVESLQAQRTEVSFHGNDGDYVTVGRSYRYNPHDALISITSFNNTVHATVRGDTSWYFDAAAPLPRGLVPGTYRKATRYPFQDPKSPGLDFSGDGRGCYAIEGKFIIHEVKTSDSTGALEKLDMTFVQHCEGGAPAARGRLLLNAVPHEQLAPKFRATRLRYGDRP